MCRLPPLLPDSRHNLVVHCLMDYRLTGAAVFMGAALRARQRPGAFAPLEHFAEGKISPQGGFTPPEDIKKTGSPPAFTLVGRDCPPMAQEKAIAAAKALAEEG